MSLKAKIEAVIYASEEPVTLAQLAGLLGLEAQTELDELDAQQQPLALEDFPDADDALNEEITDPEILVADEPQASTAPQTAAADAPVEAADAKTQAAAQKLRDRRLREHFRYLLDQLIADYADPARGLEIREVAGGFRLATKPEYHDAVRGFVKALKPPLKLTLQALETLAVVAYKQPVTAPEVAEIRGVDSAGVLGSLLARKLVTTAGRKQVIGRPILYKTTRDFLLRFGLKDIAELPSIEEFEKMAGELGDAIQEEIPMDDTQTESDSPPQDVPSGTSAGVTEAQSAPEPTHIHHDTPEDLMSDRSSSPEGVRLETSHAHSFEESADIHAAQADGTPEDDPGTTLNA